MSVSRETASALVRELFELQRVMRRVLKAAAPERELSPVQLSLLSYLELVAARRAKDIAVDSGLGASVTSRQLAHLEAAGHIRRAPDPHDGRAQLVSITERGRRAVVEHLTADTERLIDRLGQLGEEQAEATRRHLARMTQLLLESLGLERMTAALPQLDPDGADPRGATIRSTTPEPIARPLEDTVS